MPWVATTVPYGESGYYEYCCFHGKAGDSEPSFAKVVVADDDKRPFLQELGNGKKKQIPQPTPSLFSLWSTRIRTNIATWTDLHQAEKRTYLGSIRNGDTISDDDGSNGDCCSGNHFDSMPLLRRP